MCTAPYGRNFRGAGGRSDQCSVKAWRKKCTGIHSNEITMSGSKNPITGCDRLAGKVSTINAGRLWLKWVQNTTNRLCAWRHNIPPPLYSPVGAQSRASPSRCNVDSTIPRRIRSLADRCSVTRAIAVPIPRPLSVLDLGPMYATDRLQTKASLNAPSLLGEGA